MIWRAMSARPYWPGVDADGLEGRGGRHAVFPAHHVQQVAHGVAVVPLHRGLHSFNFQLNVIAFCGIWGASRACLGLFRGY
jgi:hypothetical protein